MRQGELIQPAYVSFPEYEFTRGPAVVEICEMAGFIPDPEQRLALDIIFAINDAGKLAAYEFAIIACRQNIKTGLFKMAALGWLFITDERLIVWSAHEFSTAQEAHSDMCDLIKGCPELDAQVAHYYYGNGDESIELHNGCRLIFKARTKGGGRGLSGDKVVLDEAFALQDTHMGALVPLMRARPDGQLIYGSSAPKPDARVLHRLMKRGRAGNSKRLAYLEWSAPEGGCLEIECDHEAGMRVGCALDDRENWQLANTALGRRITFEGMQAERDLLSVAEFARELLGWPEAPDDAAASIFEPGQWEACSVPIGTSSIERQLCFGLAVALGGSDASIGSAGYAPAGQCGCPLDGNGICVTHPLGRLHVEPVESKRGSGWAIERAYELQQKHSAVIVVDGRGPAAHLIPKLEDRGVTVTVAATGDVLDAHADLVDAVATTMLAHMSYPELDGAVAGAVERMIGDRPALGRKTSAFNICPLEAVELAAWGAVRNLQGDYDVMDSFF